MLNSCKIGSMLICEAFIPIRCLSFRNYLPSDFYKAYFAHMSLLQFVWLV